MNEQMPDPTYQAEYSILYDQLIKLQNLEEEFENLKNKSKQDTTYGIGYDKQLNLTCLYLKIATEEFYDCLLYIKKLMEKDGM